MDLLIVYCPLPVIFAAIQKIHCVTLNNDVSILHGKYY